MWCDADIAYIVILTDFLDRIVQRPSWYCLFDRRDEFVIVRKEIVPHRGIKHGANMRYFGGDRYDISDLDAIVVYRQERGVR